MKKITIGWFLAVLEVAKVVFNVSKLLFSSTYAKDRQWQAVVTLKMHNSSLDRLGARHPHLDVDSYFENHWARSTNQLRRHVFY